MKVQAQFQSGTRVSYSAETFGDGTLVSVRVSGQGKSVTVPIELLAAVFGELPLKLLSGTVRPGLKIERIG